MVARSASSPAVGTDSSVRRAHLGEVAFEIASQMELAQVRAVAVRHTLQSCAADSATLFLVDQARGVLTFEVVEDASADRLKTATLPLGQGIAGRVAADGRVRHYARDDDSSELFRQTDERSGFRAGTILAVPVTFAGTTLGVLEAVRAESKPPFSRDDLAFLANLAPYVAAAVRHAQSEEELRASRIALESSNRDLERRVAERTQLISRGKREWEATFDAISDPIAVLDGFVVRRANETFRSAAGNLPWNSIIGNTCHRVLAGRDTPCEGCPLRAGQQSADVALGASTYQVTTYELPSGEAGAGRVMHYRDVTEQRGLADRLGESERLAVVGQLASGAAHEINNPLAMLSANLDMLRDGLARALGPDSTLERARSAAALGEQAEALSLLASASELPEQATEVQQLLEDALVGARRIGEVVKCLRQLSRQEGGRPDPTALGPAVERAARRVLGERHGAALLFDATNLVLASGAQLDVALGHVIKNARQAVSSDSAVSIRSWDEKDATVLEIKDSGCGIPAEHLPHVCEPFFTTRPVGEGKGLGLAVTYAIVKRAGGELAIESTVGKGTTVRLRFPAHRRAEVAPASTPAHGRYADNFDRMPSGLFTSQRSAVGVKP